MYCDFFRSIKIYSRVILRYWENLIQIWSKRRNITISCLRENILKIIGIFDTRIQEKERVCIKQIFVSWNKRSVLYHSQKLFEYVF